MRNCVLIFISIICSLPIYSQEHKIIYIFPDNVEVAVNKFINKETREKTCHYLVIVKDTVDTYKLIVPSYRPSDRSHLSYYVESTNRMAIINDKQYPLLFDYDYRFGTRDTVNVGRYGERDGFILRTMPIYDAYTIHFRTDGTIIKEGYR